MCTTDWPELYAHEAVSPPPPPLPPLFLSPPPRSEEWAGHAIFVSRNVGVVKPTALTVVLCQQSQKSWENNKKRIHQVKSKDSIHEHDNPVDAFVPRSRLKLELEVADYCSVKQLSLDSKHQGQGSSTTLEKIPRHNYVGIRDKDFFRAVRDNIVECVCGMNCHYKAKYIWIMPNFDLRGSVIHVPAVCFGDVASREIRFRAILLLLC